LLGKLYEKTIKPENVQPAQPAVEEKTEQIKTEQVKTEQIHQEPVKEQKSETIDLINSLKKTNRIDFFDIEERASLDGIKILTSNAERKTVIKNTFNMGKLLFITAIIIFFIVFAEATAIYFLKDYLNIVSYKYIFTVLYADISMLVLFFMLFLFGFKKNCRFKNETNYISTTVILNILAVLAVSAIFILKIDDMFNIINLLKYLVIPCVLSLNLTLFALIYKGFTKRLRKKKI
jgi:hypothetical protein